MYTGSKTINTCKLSKLKSLTNYCYYGWLFNKNQWLEAVIWAFATNS